MGGGLFDQAVSDGRNVTGARRPRRSRGDTFCDKVAALLESRPGEWIDAFEFVKVAGHLAWRTRISEVRRHYGLNVENRQYKRGRFTISEYRLVAPVRGKPDLGGAA